MYLVFDIGGTVIKYCLMNDQGQISQQCLMKSGQKFS